MMPKKSKLNQGKGNGNGKEEMSYICIYIDRPANLNAVRNEPK